MKSTGQEETEARSKKPETPKIWKLRDPVHGLIVFGDGDDKFQDCIDQIALRLIDTPEFQRLRRIRQLGLSSFVYPGATHSRFEHSIGTYHIARQLIRIIKKKKIKDFSEDRARVVLLGALLHDLGHGPLSHVFEVIHKAAYSEKEQESVPIWMEEDHETRSSAIVKYEKSGVYKVLQCACKNCGCKCSCQCQTCSSPPDKNKKQSKSEDDCKCLPQQISSLLRQKQPYDIYDSIVSSQFDADRLDYLQRDRMMTGVQCGHIDFAWLLACLEVGNLPVPETSESIEGLYLNSKGRMVANDYLAARFRLHKTVYYHKATKAAEAMLTRLLFLMAKNLKELKKSASEEKACLTRQLIKVSPVLECLNYGSDKSDPSPDTTKSLPLCLFLKLDDAQVWVAVSALASPEYRTVVPSEIAQLAKGLKNRQLYKVLREYNTGRGIGHDQRSEVERFRKKPSENP